MNSVYTAALTFVGQNVGAGKYARIKKISFLCVGLVTFIGVSLGVVLVVFGEKLLLIFATGENKDAVVKAGMNRLLVMGTTYFLCGLMDSEGSGPSEEELSAKVGAIARELAEIDDAE